MDRLITPRSITILSVVWGFALATIFRESCKGNCIIYQNKKGTYFY